jgi:hypothetical protein
MDISFRRGDYISHVELLGGECDVASEQKNPAHVKRKRRP